VGGGLHNGCVQFADREAMISRGTISKITVYHAGFIHGIRLWYGEDGAGNVHGLTKDIPATEWPVPDGERITRVEGEVKGRYVSRLQFFTEGGQSSPLFGGQRGNPFVVSDPAGGALRAISGWANLKQHPSLYRALALMTFHFGAPYFIKSIEYDMAALESARKDATPEQCATQDFTNRTSVEQASTYSNTLTVKKTTKLTFERSYGLKFGAEAFAEGSVGVVKAGVTLSLEASQKTTSSRSFSSSRDEAVSWTVPVRVPPSARIVATSTWRKYRVSIPFTYTVAWYEGTKDNIKKEVTLPGVYEDVRVDDLKHEFAESRLN
jgi:hypothetical protein